MSLVDPLPIVRALPQADKLRLIHLLVTDLAREEGIPLIEEQGPYPIWTPYNPFEAAATLWQALDQERAAP
jgi:hypothetical protein